MSWFSREKFILPMPGLWKEMYLDTNAWSDLAKGCRPSFQLDFWLKNNAGFLAMTPQASVELCRCPSLANRLVEFMAPRKTVLLTHGKDEITGKKIFWASWYDLWFPIDFREDVAREIFIDEMQRGFIHDAAEQVRANMVWLKTWLQESLRDAPPPGKAPWTRFDRLFEKWVLSRVSNEGHPLVRDGLTDPDCYRGERLQFAYLFERFYISRKRWSDSDFVDFLHLREMAYADAVITEQGLAYFIREVQRRISEVGPKEVYDLSWLGS